MSLRNRLAQGLAICAALLLAGCGFQPLYAEKADDSASLALAGVKVDDVGAVAGEKRMGQQFKENLEDQLNPGGAVPANAPYRLTATLTSSEAPIGIARDGTVSRYNIYLDSSYKLFRTSDGKQVTGGSLRYVSSYNNVTNAYFSTYVSQEDAIKRGVVELSQLFRQRLGAYLQAGAPEQKITTPVAAPVPPNPAFNAIPVGSIPIQMNQFNRFQ